MSSDIDLHCHTDVSDGTLTPSEIIISAKKAGINMLAITDHDTIDGVMEGRQAGEINGVKVIPGAEISVSHPFSGTMHICCYNIDIGNKELLAALDYIQEARRTRNPMIIEKLNNRNIYITIKEVQQFAGNGQVGRPHIAQVLLKKGYVTTIEEAFYKYLAANASCYVQKKRLLVNEAINIIHNAGGIAVLAHPGTVLAANEKAYKDVFKYLKNIGLSGIEAYSTHHSTDQIRMFKKLAEEMDLLVTGGSDFHGDHHPGIKLGEFGADEDFPVNELKTKLQKQIINI